MRCDLLWRRSSGSETIVSSIPLPILEVWGRFCNTACPTIFLPLSVAVNPGSFRTLWNVEDAAAILLTWPHGGPKRHVALGACLLALQGGSVAEARHTSSRRPTRLACSCARASFRSPAKIMNRISWARIGAIHPDMKGEQHHFLARDSTGQDIGIVRRIESGAEAKKWLWALTRVHPGKPFPPPRSGTTGTRKEAALTLAECWRRYVKWYGIEG